MRSALDKKRANQLVTLARCRMEAVVVLAKAVSRTCGDEMIGGFKWLEIVAVGWDHFIIAIALPWIMAYCPQKTHDEDHE